MLAPPTKIYLGGGGPPRHTSRKNRCTRQGNCKVHVWPHKEKTSNITNAKRYFLEIPYYIFLQERFLIKSLLNIPFDVYLVLSGFFNEISGYLKLEILGTSQVQHN